MNMLISKMKRPLVALVAVLMLGAGAAMAYDSCNPCSRPVKIYRPRPVRTRRCGRRPCGESYSYVVRSEPTYRVVRYAEPVTYSYSRSYSSDVVPATEPPPPCSSCQ